MRWEKLWADLVAQADAWDREDFDAEVDDRERVEAATITLMDRLRACSGRRLQVQVRGGRRWDGILVAHGSDWVALEGAPDSGAWQVVIPEAAVLAVRGLSDRAVPAAALGPVAGRVSLAMVVRRAAQAAQQVCLHLDDGAVLRGDVGRVGRDYLDLVDDTGATWSVAADAIVGVTAG